MRNASVPVIMSKMLSFFWLAVLVEGGLAVVAVAVDALFRLGLDFRQIIWCDAETIGHIILGLFPLIAGYFVLLTLPFESLRRIDCIVCEFYRLYLKGMSLWQLAVIALLAGIGEEMFFRGLIQFGLSNVLELWQAVLIASLIFALAHAVTPAYFILTFFVSIYLGVLFIQTGNLFVPIAIHALYDFFVFIVLRYRFKEVDANVDANPE